MTRRPPTTPPVDEDFEDEDDAYETRGPVMVNVISAEGAFRLLLVLLTIWTLFEGFALATGALSPVDPGTDRTSERILGGLMIVLGGVYAMIAWRRDQYRLLLWVPFASQLAIVVPLVLSFPDGAPLLVISGMFLALMCYVWWRAREMEQAMDFDDEDDDEIEDVDVRREAASSTAQAKRGADAHEPGRRPRSFRRRDS